MAKKTDSNHFDTQEPSGGSLYQAEDLVLEPIRIDPDSGQGALVDRRVDSNRRNSTWWSFLYGNFHPRRRSSRREVDQDHFWFDWHEPRILYLSICVLLLSCVDALFTLNLLKIGASEANIVMASMLAHGVEQFVAVKIGITSLSLLVLAAAARRVFFGSFSVEHLLKLFCVGYILVIYYEVYLFTYIFEGNLFSNILLAR